MTNTHAQYVITIRVAPAWNVVWVICPVCFWEIEGDEDKRDDTAKPTGGPNGDLSIDQARDNYRRFGAVKEEFIKNVREPRISEIKILLRKMDPAKSPYKELWALF